MNRQEKERSQRRESRNRRRRHGREGRTAVVLRTVHPRHQPGQPPSPKRPNREHTQRDQARTAVPLLFSLMTSAIPDQIPQLFPEAKPVPAPWPPRAARTGPGAPPADHRGRHGCKGPRCSQDAQRPDPAPGRGTFRPRATGWTTSGSRTAERRAATASACLAVDMNNHQHLAESPALQLLRTRSCNAQSGV